MKINTVCGKILEGENLGESMLLKLLARKILANLPAVDPVSPRVSRLAASAFHPRANKHGGIFIQH